ncbi:MAG: PorV/PorQ family protein [Elusimicrobia bacterium]|nr:PorV/PorQ family protein [Candidatus Obscuribacterium magneticum]
MNMELLMRTLQPSFRRKPESRIMLKAWTPAFAGVTRYLAPAFAGMTALLMVILPWPLHAEATYGQASDLFNIGAGARALGMGGAYTAVSDDASAPYYNPAGLAYLDEHQFMAMHAPLFMNSNYNYLATANPFGDKRGTIALSDALLYSNKFETRDQTNILTDSNASMSHNAVIASYAHVLPWRYLAAGVNAKLIQQKVVGYSGNGLGWDLGLMYRKTPLLSIGASFANINSPKVKLDTTADVYRPVTRVGLASEVIKEKLTLAVDIIKVSKESSLYAAGAELSPTKLFQLRAGYGANQSYTFGLGIKINPFRIDYAFSDTDLGVFNKVSVTWAWHNIYKTDLEPPMREGRAIYPLSGFENQVAFRTSVPHQMVARWSLVIKNADGQVMRTLEADLRPPEIIAWDAKNSVGEPMVDGKYKYEFLVNYKNGKEWRVNGDVDLVLPKPVFDEENDMNLKLNGANASEVQMQ